VFDPAEEKITLKRMKQTGFSSPRRLLFKELDTVAASLSRYNQPVRTVALIEQPHERAQGKEESSQRANLERLQALEIAVCLPLHLNQQLAGLILLGSKKSGAEF